MRLTGADLAGYAILNIALLAVLGAAANAGLLTHVWEGDPFGITGGIFGLSLVGVAGLLFSANAFAKLTAELAVILGLVGTVIGFAIASLSIDASAAQDNAAAMQMVTAVMQGMGVALYTTLVGAVCWIWLRINLFVVDE